MHWEMERSGSGFYLHAVNSFCCCPRCATPPPLFCPSMRRFMAPEALSSKVGPPSDIWAAGVMAYQLLSGAFPFNDWSNTRNPALSKVW